MDDNIKYLIVNSNDINSMLEIEVSKLREYLEIESSKIINELKSLFETHPNFKILLERKVTDIDTSIEFVEKNVKGINNENLKTILKSYQDLYKKLQDLHYKDSTVFKDISVRKLSFEFSMQFPLGTPLNKNPLYNRHTIVGTQEYFEKQKLDKIFVDFTAYNIFYHFMELFKKEAKYIFNHSDGSYLFRKMFEKKYIVQSVYESDFRFEIFDKMGLDKFEKLKTLNSSESIYRNIIFNLTEKQIRPQKNSFRS